MVARTQINRSRTNGYRPPDSTREIGELFVNIPDRQLSVMDTSSDPQDLIAVRFWNAVTAFHLGDIVFRTGDLRRCVVTNATVGVYVSAEWDTLATMNDITSAAVGATEGLKAYSELAVYVLNDLVSYQGSIYRNIVEIAVPEPWTPAHWQDIAPTQIPEPVPFYSATTAYALGDLVVHSGSIYRNTTAIVAPGEAWNAAHWLAIAPTPPPAADGGPTNEPPQDGNYYVRQNHVWVRTALWEPSGTDVLLKISGTAVIRIQADGDLLVKGDVEVFSVGV